MADKMESVREKCALIDNATREADDWRARCHRVAAYICAQYPVGHPVRNSVLDLINGKERTPEQRAQDAQTLWTKLSSNRDYVIRLREELNDWPSVKDSLRAIGLWPPPHTELEDIE